MMVLVFGLAANLLFGVGVITPPPIIKPADFIIPLLILGQPLQWWAFPFNVQISLLFGQVRK
jgi:hypothetical protein